MQLTHITCLLIFLLASHRALADEDSSTETNEIIPREAIQKLDFSVRQALLRAIDKLEKEASDSDDNANKTNDSGDGDKIESSTITPSSVTIQSTTVLPLNTQTKDEILEESTSSSDVFPSVQFFTATFDENNAQEQPLAVYIDKSKMKNHKNLGSPAEVSNSVQKEPKSNNQAVRSVSNTNLKSNEISLNSLDEIKFEIRNSKSNEKPTSTTTTTTTPRPRTTKKRTTTTSTTTTTTTPRPTHNEDGENIEVVAKEDVRILAAPLISAFTLDLDELGAAKKVISIIDNPPTTATTAISSTLRTSIFQPPLFGPTITKLNVSPAEAQRSAALNLANNLPPAPVPTQSTFSSSTVSNIFSNIVPTFGHYITKSPQATSLNQQQPQHQQGSNVNNYLIEKQRELEQQIYQLKFQAQQQQELIIRQLKLLEEQAKQRSNPTSDTQLALPQSTNSLIQQTQVQQQQQPQQLSLVQQQQQEPGFTIRPSVEFIPNTQSKLNPIFPAFSLQQQLPLKESNGKYINGVQQQLNNGFPNNILQPPSQQQQQQQPQQRLPIENNPIKQVFQKLQNLQNLQKTNTQAASSISSIQIQPSNQLNIAPTFASLLPQVPAELSLVQALPQRNYQQFQQIVPQYVTNALLERQQQQQQQQNRARLFRQEGNTANFGTNQVQIQPSSNIFSSYNNQQPSSNSFDNQNFYRQHLTQAFSNQLQQNAQQFYQQQQQQQQLQQAQQSSPTGNFLYNQRFHRNRFNSLNNNLEEFNIINKVLALNHGINNFAPQPLLPPSQSSAPGTQSLAQSARFSSNIF